MKYPSADVLASNKLRKLAIECKTCIEKNKYLPKEEVEQLKQFADIFGAEPWIAIKFKRHEWFFVSLADIAETSKSFVIDNESIKSIGLLFEELVSK